MACLVVKLTVKKIDGEIKHVAIKRGLVELEELYAKSTLISKNNKNYGYISLPKFYVDFSDKNSRNSANDVKNEIIKLKNNGIKGLILDLALSKEKLQFLLPSSLFVHKVWLEIL